MGLDPNHPAIKKLLERAANPQALKRPNHPATKGGVPPKATGIPSHIAGKLNQTEEKFLAIAKEEWDTVLFERITIPINMLERCTYTPDALCMSPGKNPRFYEVKGGFWRDDARVKCNIAARLSGPAEVWQAVLSKKEWKNRRIAGETLNPSEELEGDASFLLKHYLTDDSGEKPKRAELTLPTFRTRFQDGKIEFLLRPRQVSLAAARHRKSHPKRSQTVMGEDFFSKDPEKVINAWKETFPHTVILNLLGE